MDELKRRVLLRFFEFLEDKGMHKISEPLFARLIYLFNSETSKKLDYKFTKTQSGPFSKKLLDDLKDLKEDNIFTMIEGELKLTGKAKNNSILTEKISKEVDNFIDELASILSRCNSRKEISDKLYNIEEVKEVDVGEELP